MAPNTEQNHVNVNLTGSSSNNSRQLDSIRDKALTDPRIIYPCYKSFDEFIDVETLKALDGYLIEKIQEHIAAKNEEYFLNAYRLDADSPHQPGAREIWLSRPKQADAVAVEDVYDELDKTEIWELTAEACKFSLLVDFIKTLPFKATGRMLIIYDDAATSVPAHRDHLDTDVCHEFVWFRTNLKKPFYMLNHQSNEKKYVETYTAWFDAVNQFHGTDPVDGLSFSIRVDGRFTDEFRKRIPIPEYNLASMPALWASDFI